MESKELKVCSLCGVEKPLTSFFKKSSSKDGFKSQCKECSKKYFQRQDVKDKRHAYFREWYHKNKDITKEKQTAYRKRIRMLRKDQNIIEKICNSCKVTKPIDQFYKNNGHKDGHSYACKQCTYAYKYINRERINLKSRERYLIKKANNPDYVKHRYLRYRDTFLINNKRFKSKNRTRYLEWRKEYRLLNKDKIKKQRHARWLVNKYKIKRIRNNYKDNEYQRNRRRTDIGYRLRKNISTAVCQALKHRKGTKEGWSFFKHIGYTAKDLKEHLERQFSLNMSWDNYGTYWEIHHVIPLASFKCTSMKDSDFLKCWALSNLLPLEQTENARLGQMYKNNPQEYFSKYVNVSVAA